MIWNRYFDDGAVESQEFNSICKDYGLFPLVDREGIDSMREDEERGIRDSGSFSRIRYYEYPWETECLFDDFLNFLKTSNSYMDMSEASKEVLH